MAILSVLILVVLNGILSMAEIAIISGRKTLIQKLSQEGDHRAQAVMRLSDNPNMLFSIVQIGITLISILSGAIGIIAFQEPFESLLTSTGLSSSASHIIGLVCFVIFTTYISVIFGELIPKRIGLQHSERISMLMARPMLILARIFAPVVNIFSATTELVLRSIGVRQQRTPPVSPEEVRQLVQQGAAHGVFRHTERHIVERTLSLGEVRVNTLMTARSKIVWVELNEPIDQITTKVIKNPYSYFPVCEGSLDKIIGIISGDTLLASVIGEKKVHIKDMMYQPLFIPAHVKALHVLELFKKNKIHQGIVIDEYGNAEGLVTLTDILEAIVGNFPEQRQPEDKKIIQRTRTSWYVDGLVLMSEFKKYFKITQLPDEKDAGYNTIGGFVMHKLGRMPVTGDHFMLNGYQIEVADMDEKRVDKILVSLR